MLLFLSSSIYLETHYVLNWVGTVHTAWILQSPPRFYISVSWRRHTLKLRLPLWGKSASYICNHKLICHRDFLPAVRLSEGLADDHRDRLLAVPRDCPLKIKIVRGKRKICAVWTVVFAGFTKHLGSVQLLISYTAAKQHFWSLFLKHLGMNHC